MVTDDDKPKPGDDPVQAYRKRRNRRQRKKAKKRKADAALANCDHVPAIYGSFVNVLFDHAVGNQVLGPTKNPCPAFFRSPDRGDVWSEENWGHYPTFEVDPISNVPAAERLVAVGDLHGDLQKTEEVLKLANVLSHRGDKWCGGETVLVQVGDIIDRGGGELKIYYLLEKLRREAPRHGGAVYCLHGNHEVMNMNGRFNYATYEAIQEFNNWHSWYLIQGAMRRMVEGTKLGLNYMAGMPAFEEVKDIDQLEYEGKTWNGLIGRTLAMRPGGPFCGRFLAHYSTLLIVGKSLFVHGGVRQENLSNGIEDIVMYNREVSQWVKGLCEDYDPPYIVTSGGHGIKNTAVTWNREYGLYKNIPCDSLANTLEKVKCSRMMIGHTIQGPLGINAVCKGAVVRIDVGMSKGCGNREPQALEILDDERLNVISRKGTKPLDVTAASTALDPPSDPNEDTSVNTTGTRMKITPSKRKPPGDDAPLQARCTVM